MKKIGTVEILRFRVYALDHTATGPGNMTVAVQPGTYEVFRDGITYFWMMTGNINKGGWWREGDGLFRVSSGDDPTGPEVLFPSIFFGPDEFRDLLSSTTCEEGHPEQRLRFDLVEELVA